MRGSFLKKDVAEIVGITPRTVHYYTEIGLITPEIDGRGGKGAKRKYSRRNLMEFLVIKELADKGLDLATIKEIISGPKVLSSEGFNPWDPDSKGPENRRYYVILYYKSKEHGTLKLTSGELDGKLQLNMQEYTSAAVIDLNKLRRRISEL